ncbi:MAG: hypothetical protein ACREO5_10545 [Candidatus Binatia bacterium]
MKKLAISGLIVTAFLFALGISATAQVSRQYEINIPFDFSVRGKVAKAGDYTIGPASGITNVRALVLRNRSNAKGDIVVGQTTFHPIELDRNGTITFVRSGDGWALRSIETPGFALKLKSTKYEETLEASAGSTGTHTIMLIR